MTYLPNAFPTLLKSAQFKPIQFLLPLPSYFYNKQKQFQKRAPISKTIPKNWQPFKNRTKN